VSASKKPRKKYNPAKAFNKAARHQEGKCYLYRWESAAKSKDGVFSFSGYENLSRDQQEMLMQRAMNSSREWVCLIHACYVSGANDYYEESAEFITPMVKLSDDAEAVEDLIQAALSDVRGAGNPNHYIDSVVVLRPATAAFRRMVDDDEWFKRQADYRSRLILETVRDERKNL